MTPEDLGIRFQVGLGCTEIHNGIRLAQQIDGHFKWCKEVGWLRYQGGRWVPDTTDQIIEEAKSVVALMMDITLHNVPGSVAGLSDWAKASMSTRRIKAMVDLAHSAPEVAVNLSAFDADPLLLCCADGVLSLREEDCGRLLPHSPDFLMTKTTGVEMAPYVDSDGFVRLDLGECPAWQGHLQFMAQHLPVDRAEEFWRFYQRWAGIGLLGDQNLKPHHFLNLTGEGRNGKGVATEARAHALGDYGYIAPMRLLTRRQSDHSTETASCRGKRLVGVEEVSLVQAAVIKDLTGGGKMTARSMRRDDQSFLKSWGLEIMTNGPINLQGEGSKAMRNRRIVVHLGDESNPDLRKDGIPLQLQHPLEAAGILAWSLEGLRGWYASGGGTSGLLIPQWAKDESEGESDADDIVQTVLIESYQSCSGGEGCKVLGSEFVKLVNAMRRDSGFSALQPSAIYAEVRRRHGLTVRVGKGNKTFIHGIVRNPVSFEDLVGRAAGAMSQN